MRIKQVPKSFPAQDFTSQGLSEAIRLRISLVLNDSHSDSNSSQLALRESQGQVAHLE